MVRCFSAGIMILAMLFKGTAHGNEYSVGPCGALGANEGGLQTEAVNAPDLDRWITAFLSNAGLTPGVSVVIVKDDAIVYSRGFGYRTLDPCEQASANTRYYLKSATKSFLGLGAALLHEQGAIALDQPITEYLPNLVMPEGINAAQVSLRSHFTHTLPYDDSGLNYRTAFPGNLPDDELVAHINRHGRAREITFRYSNFGPIVGAHAIYAKTGMHWRDLVASNVFKPAGMLDSFTSMSEARTGPLATAYLTKDGELVPTLTKTDPMMHAAGGTVSTVADLGRWIILNLNQGRIDGKQVFPARAIEHAQARLVYLDQDFLEFGRFAHGLGIYSADYGGELLMHHFGGETHVSFMPEHGYGIAILSNAISDGVVVTHRLAATIYDYLLGVEDLGARVRERQNAIAEFLSRRAQRLEEYMAQVAGNVPAEPATRTPEMVAGDYVNERLGRMTVARAGDDRLTVTFGALSAAMVRLGGDSYLVEIDPWRGMPPQVFAFREEANGVQVLAWGQRIFTRAD